MTLKVNVEYVCCDMRFRTARDRIGFIDHMRRHDGVQCVVQRDGRIVLSPAPRRFQVSQAVVEEHHGFQPTYFVDHPVAQERPEYNIPFALTVHMANGNTIEYQPDTYQPVSYYGPQRKKETDDMINYDARNIAQEILTDRKTDGLRERVSAAVEHLAEMFAEAGDGSVFSFGKTVGERTYHYAAIKSGGAWYSTGSKTALAGGDDDELITWLIGLEIYGADDILAIAKTDQPALIEGTVADDV